MKKYLYLAVFAIILIGCKDMLDRIEENTVPVVDIDHANPENLFMPVSAAYAKMRNNDAHTIPYIGAFEIASDNANKGSSPSDAPALKELDDIIFLPGNYLFNALWTSYFGIVSGANYAIEQMPLFEKALPSLTDKLLARQAMAEAKVIRAYAYWNLTRLFGRVPIIEKTLSANELANIPQSSSADLYKFIKKDLLEAIAVLPTDYSTEYPGRINKYIAMAIKAKVHLYCNEPDSVASLTDQIISTKRHRLLADFRVVFSLAGKNSVESIFEIQCSTLGKTEGDETFLLYCLAQGPRNNSPSNLQGWGLCVPSDNLISFFKSRDEKIRPATTLLYRKTLTPEGDSIKWNCENPVYNGKVYTPSYQNKWNFNGYGFDQNLRIMRYSDILLMYCEAKFKGATVVTKSGLSALDAINLVRERAGLAKLTSLTKEVIWDERRAELAMEEDRYFDLIRTGQAVTVLGPKGWKENKNEVYPIPSAQLDINKHFTQNPGY